MASERVGIILKTGSVVELHNINPDPENSFSVDPRDMVKYESEIIATWHTHPQTNASLSGDDYIGFQMWPRFLHLIFGMDGVKGYTVDKGMVIEDACKDHPAWRFTGELAARL